MSKYVKISYSFYNHNTTSKKSLSLIMCIIRVLFLMIKPDYHYYYSNNIRAVNSVMSII